MGRVPIFAGLAPEELQEIAGRVRLRRHVRNEQLYGAGENNPFLMIIHSGQVKIFRITESGHEQLIRVLGEGDFLGDMSFISGAPKDHFATTLETAEICALHHDDLRDYLLRYPSVTYKMLETLSSRLESTERQLSALAGEDADHRLAAYLLELADEHPTAKFPLPIAKKDVASFLGLTPETLSRKLTQFEDAGMIRQHPRRTIELVDVPALHRL